MAYATLNDVQNRMPQFQLTAVSRPSLETSQTFLDDVHLQFDAVCENIGYVVPLTGQRAIGQAREIICNGAIARILFARAASNGGDAAVASAERAHKLYEDAITNLADPNHPMEFTDAKRTADEIKKPGGELSGLLTDDDGNDIEPRFRMNSLF